MNEELPQARIHFKCPCGFTAYEEVIWLQAFYEYDPNTGYKGKAEYLPLPTYHTCKEVHGSTHDKTT